jgi:hypothetical protein
MDDTHSSKPTHAPHATATSSRPRPGACYRRGIRELGRHRVGSDVELDDDDREDRPAAGEYDAAEHLGHGHGRSTSERERRQLVELADLLLLQWQRCASDGGGCGAIAGADSQHYTVSSTDIGHRLRVQVTAHNSGGSGTATSSATDVVQAAGTAPANTKAPSVSGTPQEGGKLTVNVGTWSGSTPIKFDYTWQRCDANGNGCSTFIAHNPNADSYTLVSADVGHTLRVEVTATNAYGSGYLDSPHTAVVTAKTVQHVTTVSVNGVSLPDRLVIDGVQFSPNPTLSRTTPIQARFHVSDSHGLSVQGALVFVLGLPYGWAYNAPEQATGADGWVTLTIRPTRNMPLHRGDLVMFVRARKPGDSLLAGVSTRRLVQEGIR